MKPFQTPNSCHSRKGSAKVNRQPFAIISNCPEYQQCANYLQSKVQGLEMRVKNLNSHHASENRSTTASKTTSNLSPFNTNKQCKKYGSNKQIDTQSYYETIINKRLENISKIDQSPIKTEQSINQDKYSVHSLISHQTRLNQNCIQKIQTLTRRLRQFKLVKDQNQDECAPSLAKIKCFCQEFSNECFDFYRCTDLITLKYFIYLLLQELNNNSETYRGNDNQHYVQQIEFLKSQLENQNTDQMTFKGQIKLQKMVYDTQNLIQEIVNQLQSQNNQNVLTNQVDILNRQIKTLKDNMDQQQFLKSSFGVNLANYETNENNNSLINQSNYKTNEDRFMTQMSSKSKSPYCRNNRKIQMDGDSQNNLRLLEEQTIINRQLMEKIFELQSTDKQNYAIQELQDQLNEKNKQINELQKNIKNQECYSELNQRILDISKNLDNVIQQNSTLLQENEQLKIKIDQMKQLEQKYYDILQENNKQCQQINSIINDNCQLKKIQQQYEAECKGYQQQILKLQEKCEVLQASLQDQNDSKYLQQQINDLLQQQQEQNKIISLITDEALYLGQMTLYTNDLLQKQQGDIPTSIRVLQKDLNNKKATIQQKMKILQQFGNNMKIKQCISHNSSFKTSSEVDLLENLDNDIIPMKCQQQQNQHNDLMTMLVVQCHTIEKMIDF
ncbi:unnamed protein product [Paramecium pentaurelia]|uniref:Uncharacterized protein n=1 Tax=Paramecium pentaurelia TaxID=43138 RepID=A0A8S1TZ66_9CILI|nr:unnamed protein product [Paramecium pentaurelia]